ncbi:MAG: hypothetical protein NZO58_04270 [Gemmataceae bacterium]|nr:hypothetical protein [Gemmataceae bacterium]
MASYRSIVRRWLSALAPMLVSAAGMDAQEPSFHRPDQNEPMVLPLVVAGSLQVRAAAKPGPQSPAHVKKPAGLFQPLKHSAPSVSTTGVPVSATDPDRHFAQTAGLSRTTTTSAAATAIPTLLSRGNRKRTVPPVPAVHLTPIGVMPPTDASK